MTIDESIAHAREVAKKNREYCECNKICLTNRWVSNIECAKEHEQLAEWLEELKELRSQKIKPIATIKFDKETLQEILDKKIKEMEVNIEYDIQKIRSDAIEEFQKEITTYLENKIDNSYRGDSYQLGKISAYEEILKKLKDVVVMSC